MKWVIIVATLLYPVVFMPVMLLAQPASISDGMGEEAQENDPLQKMNRGIDKFNSGFDKIALKPATEAYRKSIPVWGRTRIGNFLRNLATPVTFANNLLQGDGNQALISFWRFMLNSTFGLGGTFDIAATQGLRDRVEDFGQTMGSYGVGSGPYLILPFFGPSSLRDAPGKVVDAFLDPFNYILPDEAIIARQVVDALETRSQTLALTNEIERTSLDPYVTVRSLYLQSRADQVSNGAISDMDYQE